LAGDVDPTKREKLLRALLEDPNNTKAAKASGYSRKHVKELVKDPAFVRELERRRAALPPPGPADPDEERALEAARAIVDDEEQPGTARVAAAKLLLDRVDKRRGPKTVVPTTQDPTEVAPPKSRETPAEAAKRFGIKLA
jgi:hypothetical protein